MHPRLRTARFRRIGAAVLACVAACAVSAPWLHARLRCAGLFLRMEGARAPAWLQHYGEHAIDERAIRLRTGVAARLYLPRNHADAPGLVLAHGIHEDGIREPRLVRFARAIASSGFAVLTPELSDLARYRVTRAGADVIGQSAAEFAAQRHQNAVSVFGISFGGGLALRAACDPRWRARLGRIIALGAHHDARAVARFFLGEPARGPDGSTAALKPHSYGATVLFAWLFGEPHRGALKGAEIGRVERALAEHAADLDDASPAHCREKLRVPVHLAHGLGDRIVPYTETLWNAAQFGAQTSLDVLVSPVLGHAEYAPPTLWERFQLVDFMARALP